MQIQLRPNDLIRTLKVIFACFAAAFLISCGPDDPPPTPTPTPEPFNLATIVGSISNERIQAEQRVRLLKEDRQNGNQDAQTYDNVRAAYNNAEAAFNSWLRALRAGIQTREQIDQNPDYRKSLQIAIDKSQNFINYADAHHSIALLNQKLRESGRSPEPVGGGAPSGGSSKPDIAGIIASVIEPVANTGVKLWDAYQKANDAERARILTTLEAEDWKPFETIE